MIDSLVLIFLKRGTHLGLNAIKMRKKISLALLTHLGPHPKDENFLMFLSS